MSFCTTLIDAAVKDVARPEGETGRIWLTIQEVQVLLAHKERHVADRITGPTYVTHFRQSQVGRNRHAVREVAANIRLHHLIRKHARVPMRDRGAALHRIRGEH